MLDQNKTIQISISFEKTKLPPFDDILVLGKDCPLGMNGVGQCLDFLVPDGYDRFEVDNAYVAAIIVNKSLLRSVKPNKIIEILSEKVFPYVSPLEIIKVEFSIKISYDAFAIDV